MRKAFAVGMAALTIGATVAATALPSAAEARSWHGGHGGYGYYGGWGGHHHGNDAAAAAAVAGIAGLALGAALSNGYYGYGPSYGYGPGYYGGYGYAPGYYGYGYGPSATCVTRRWAVDPYGRRVLVTTPYPC